MGGNAVRIAELLDLVKRAEASHRSVTEGELLALYCDSVNVDTPSGVRLVDGLSFSVTKGESLVLTGANGVGKTSILRTLKGLWPAGSGQAGYPRGTVFLPQSPYCPTGSLQDQVTYPEVLPEPMPTAVLRGHLEQVSATFILSWLVAGLGSHSGDDGR